MLVAGKVANSLGAEIKLIDKAMPTIMGAWKNMPWIELWRMMKRKCCLIGRSDSNFGSSMVQDFIKGWMNFQNIIP